jgi:hypothetical protein
MRRGYLIALSFSVTGAVLAVTSYFLAQDGYWFYWILEVLGFSFLLVFGNLGLLLPLMYQGVDRGAAAVTGTVQLPSATASAVKCVWCQSTNSSGSTVCFRCGRPLFRP